MREGVGWLVDSPQKSVHPWPAGSLTASQPRFQRQGDSKPAAGKHGAPCLPMGSRQSWAHWLSATRGLMAPSQAMGLVVIDSTCKAVCRQGREAGFDGMGCRDTLPVGQAVAQPASCAEGLMAWVVMTSSL